MTRRFTDFAGAALAILLVAVTASFAYGGLMRKDSADFDWKYEWDAVGVYPDDVDVDGRAGGDFWDVSGSKGTRTTAPGGYLQFSSTGLNEQWQSDGHSGHAGNVWPGRFTFAEGWTIEAAIQVISGVAGKDYACDFGGGLATDSKPQGLLGIGVAGQGWAIGSTSYVALGTGTYDNTDGYHVFRVALNPGSGTYSVWRDGKLLTSAQAPSFSGPYDRCWLGDAAGLEAGTARMDYFRFTAGAWAPIPEPSMLAMLLALGVGGLLLCSRRRR